MAKTAEKQVIVQDIADTFSGAQSVVLVDYRGLTVEEDTRLRKELREAGVTYKVYKNTMVNLAVKDTEFASLAPMLKGPNAFAVSKNDATAPARILANFAKTAPNLELKAGVVEGNFYDQDGIMEVSKIPSRNELLSRLLGSMQSPMANFARVIKQIAEKDAEGAAEAPSEEAAQAAPAEAAPAAE